MRRASAQRVATDALPGGMASLLTIPLVLVYGVPLVWLVSASLKSNAEITRNPTGLVFAPAGDAYAAVTGEALWRSMAVSAQLGLGVTAIALLLGIPAAFGLSRIRGAVRHWTIGLLLVFQMIPPAASLIPLYRLLTVFGLSNSVVGLILIDTALFLPFAILLLRPFCAAVPRDVEEAALLDGARPWQLLTNVVLPLVRNGAFVVGVMVFIMTWGEFINAITFINDPELQPLSALLSRQVTQFGTRWNNLMALAVITSVPLLLLYTLVHRRLRDGLVIGAGR